MARKKTPDDLMGDLLSGKKKAPEAEPARQQASSPDLALTQETPAPQKQPAKQQDSKPASLPAEPEEKVKKTLYFSPDAVQALDELHYILRGMAAPGERGQISYSLIVEEAISQVLQELKKDGQQSQIAQRIL